MKPMMAKLEVDGAVALLLSQARGLPKHLFQAHS
jgi:hypothetical protein